MSTKEFQLQDVLDIQWGDTNATKASYVPEGYLAFSASGPDGFLEKFDYDSEGIVLSAIGANCGSTFLATGKWSCIKNTIRILPKSESVDLRYFYYMTKSPDFWPIRGSAQPFIGQTDIREMYAEFPEIEAQRKVADLLSRIDRLIKVNQKLSSVLEENAETIFKSWFIDFDPVKAKMAGEAPVGMDAETAALFPDSMEESELGLVPSGWKMRPLTDLASIRYGAAFSSKKFNSHGLGLPLIRIRDLRTQSPSIYTDEDIPRGFTARAGSLLVGMDGEFEPVIWFGEDAWVNQRVCMLQPREDCDASFLQFHLKPVLKKIEHGTVGTTVLHLGKSELDSISILYPSRELISAYAKISSAILELRISLAKESIYLRRLRDSLLPRLISGELKIPDEMLAA